MQSTGTQSRQSLGRVHFLPWQQGDSTTAVGLQALEESITQERNREQEALEKVQARVRELESYLSCQKEVRPAWGGRLEGLQEDCGGADLCCLSWPGRRNWGES